MKYECRYFERYEKPMLPQFGDDCPNCAKMATKKCRPVRKIKKPKIAPKRDAQGRFCRKELSDE